MRRENRERIAREGKSDSNRMLKRAVNACHRKGRNVPSSNKRNRKTPRFSGRTLQLRRKRKVRLSVGKGEKKGGKEGEQAIPFREREYLYGGPSTWKRRGNLYMEGSVEIHWRVRTGDNFTVFSSSGSRESCFLLRNETTFSDTKEEKKKKVDSRARPISRGPSNSRGQESSRRGGGVCRKRSSTVRSSRGWKNSRKGEKYPPRRKKEDTMKS